MVNSVDFFTTLQEKLTPEKKEEIVKAYKTRLYNDLFADKLLNELTKKGFFQEGQETIKDALTYLHNAWFRETHLQDGNSLKNLKVHTLWDIEKKRAEEEWLKNIPKYIVGELVRYVVKRRYNPHFNTMSAEEEQIIEQSRQEMLAGKNTFIITNHDTFGNIPIIIIKYMTIAHKLHIKNPNQYLYTILWPLLMTHKRQKLLINMLSNIVITQPVNNHTPEILKEVHKEQRNLASNKIKSDCLEEHPTWKVYLCAPSGTRDIVLRLKNGDPIIYLPDESSISNQLTYRLAKEIKKSGARVLLCGTNTTALKKGIAPSNNDWNKNANIAMHLQNIENAEDLNARDAIPKLQSLVKQKEEVVAKTLPYALFKLVKTLQKSWTLDAYLQEDGDLDKEKLTTLLATSNLS